MLQKNPVREADICYFFVRYGPSARNCYEACSSKETMVAFEAKLKQTIGNMGWGSIDRVLNATNFIPQTDVDSHLIVLIEPADDQRLKVKVNVISRAVMRLLWQQHGARFDRKAKELFHIFSQDRSTSITAGWLFEGPVHRLLEEGINVPLDHMGLCKNSCQNGQYDTYEASNVGSGRWESQPMQYMSASKNDRNLNLEPHHYYVAVDPTHPTYDSFTFEDIPINEYSGPTLNRDCDMLGMEPGDVVTVGATIFHIPTSKACCDVFAPMCRIPLDSLPSFM